MKAKKILSGLISVAMAISATVSMVSFTVSAEDNNFVDMSQTKIVEAMQPGWNLGNQLEAANNGIPEETTWGNPVVKKELLQAVKKAGFKSVRIPVSYLNMIGEGPDYTIDEAWLARVKEVVDYAIDEGLYVFVNMHGDGYTTVTDGWLMSTPESSGRDGVTPVPYTDEEQEEVYNKYSLVWEQIAKTFLDYDEHLVFESMNEVFDGTYNTPVLSTYEKINQYNQIFVDTVRKTGGNNAKRWLLVPGWNTDIDYTVGNYGFEIPTDEYRDESVTENRIMISVHYYGPWDFCGDGTGPNGKTQWGSDGNPLKVASYQNTEDIMEEQIKKVYDSFVTQGYPVVIGEYGCINKTEYDAANNIYRAHFDNTMCALAKEYGCVPVYWDNGAVSNSFGLINRNTYEIEMPEIIDAMMEASLTAEENVNRYIAKVSDLDESNYTAETWEPLNTAFKAAQALIEAGTDSEDELLKAYNALTEAFYKLMPSETAKADYLVGTASTLPDSASTPVSEYNDKNFNSVDSSVIDLSTSQSLVIKFKILDGEPAEDETLLILKPYSTNNWDGWNDNFISISNSEYDEEADEYTYAVNTQDILASYTGVDPNGAGGINIYYAILGDTPNIQVTYYSISYTYTHTHHHYVMTDKTYTCSENGRRIYTCTACGDTFDEVFRAPGHVWSDWTITKEATCTENGSREHTCSVCGEIATTSIKATGHDYDENDVCKVCGEKKPTEPPATEPTTAKPTTTAPTAAKPVVTTAAPKGTSVAEAKQAAKTAMKQAKITKLTVKSKAKKKITVTWKKVKKAVGYEVQVSSNKKFKKSKILVKKNVKKANVTIKNKKIKSKKTYYVRVRAYATYKDAKGATQKVYSSWNKQLRKVKVK